MADEKKKSTFDKGYEKRATRRAIRAFHGAIAQNDIAKVEELLKTDIDVNFHYAGVTALQIAVTNGHYDICKLLIDHKADVDKCNADENSLLNMAVWRQRLDICKLLVESNADMNIPNNHGCTPLNTAVYNGSTDITELLVGCSNCDVNSCDSKHRSPLITSARKGRVEHTKLLMSCRSSCCDLNWTDHEKKTALIVAAERGHADVAEELVKGKCDINAREKYGCTALLMAAKEGHLNVVQVLIKAGANLDCVDNKGNSPLMEAVRKEHLEIVKSLTAAGCSVNLKEIETEQGAIHAAVRLATQYFGPKETYTDMVQTLIDAGCDVSMSDSTGWTPLYQAAFGGEADIVSRLLKHGARVDAQTDTGNTILHAAVFCNKPEVVDMVLAAGCDVNTTNKKNALPLYIGVKYHANITVLEKLISAGSQLDVCESESGQSPLLCATQQENLEAVNCLLAAGCDVNLTSYDGESPLWMACNKGNDVIVSTLLKHPGIDISGSSSRIPLHAAAAQGNKEIAETLLKEGADVNELTTMGASALYAAADKNHTAMVKLLIQYGANPTAPSLIPPPRPCCFQYRDPHPHLELEPLYAAVKNDNFKVIKMVLFASPRMPYKVLDNLKNLIFRTGFAQEARLSQTTIYQYASFFSSVLRTPMSLQAECRGVIRVKLGKSITQKTDSLPIPAKLKEYILYRDGVECGSP